MIDEKIYTQEDLNNAVTKAILEMTELLKQKKHFIDFQRYKIDRMNETECRLQYKVKELTDELDLYKKALKMTCSQHNTNPICATEYHRDNCMSFGSCGECWENVFLQKAREE